jgi:hypothetical protein
MPRGRPILPVRRFLFQARAFHPPRGDGSAQEKGGASSTAF